MGHSRDLFATESAPAESPVLEPLLSLSSRLGRPHRTDLTEMFNLVWFLSGTACQSRAHPGVVFGRVRRLRTTSTVECDTGLLEQCMQDALPGRPWAQAACAANARRRRRLTESVRTTEPAAVLPRSEPDQPPFAEFKALLRRTAPKCLRASQ